MTTLSVKANDFERTFSSIEEYEEILDEYLELDKENHSEAEFKFDFVVGSSGERQLFGALSLEDYDDVSDYFEIIEMDYRERAAAYFATFLVSTPNVKKYIKDVILHEGNAIDAAAELFEEMYADRIPRRLHCYFDMEKFAEDLEREGDFVEFKFDGDLYTCTNAGSI